MEIFAKRLRELRKGKGLAQVQVEKDLKIPQKTLSNYETGKHFPSPDTLVIFATYYNTTTDYLLGKTDNPD